MNPWVYQTLAVLCWFSVLAIGVTYVGYPLAIWQLSQRRRKVVGGTTVPRTTFIISAFNEEDVIGKKLENTLDLDFPRERFEVIVVSDASTDRTDQIVNSFAAKEPCIRLLRQDQRLGKSAGLNHAVAAATGEIIVFSDANAMYRADAIRNLVRHFDDATVGYVVGQQRYVDDTSDVSQSESLYWRYECAIKEFESRLGCVIGGDGAIMALRRNLFEVLRPDDINDFLIPLRIVAKGYRGLYDSEAVCFEHTAPNMKGEFRRKARIVNRSLRAVMRSPRSLNPLRVGWFAVGLFCHKILRWFVPFFMLAILLISTLLAFDGSLLFQCFLGLQLATYSFLLLRFVPGLGAWKPVYLIWYFLAVNVAAGIGVLFCVFGRQVVTWRPERAGANP